MALLDSEIRDALVDLVSTIYANKRISKKEANALLFYGLYNNKWFNNAGMKNPNDLDTLISPALIDDFVPPLYWILPFGSTSHQFRLSLKSFSKSSNNLQPNPSLELHIILKFVHSRLKECGLLLFIFFMRTYKKKCEPNCLVIFLVGSGLPWI